MGSDGRNGQFLANEIGLGHFVAGGTDIVEIYWLNGSVTITAWPNRSWYDGVPLPIPNLITISVDEGTDILSSQLIFLPEEISQSATTARVAAGIFGSVLDNRMRDIDMEGGKANAKITADFLLN